VPPPLPVPPRPAPKAAATVGQAASLAMGGTSGEPAAAAGGIDSSSAASPALGDLRFSSAPPLPLALLLLCDGGRDELPSTMPSASSAACLPPALRGLLRRLPEGGTRAACGPRPPRPRPPSVRGRCWQDRLPLTVGPGASVGRRDGDCHEARGQPCGSRSRGRRAKPLAAVPTAAGPLAPGPPTAAALAVRKPTAGGAGRAAGHAAVQGGPRCGAPGLGPRGGKLELMWLMWPLLQLTQSLPPLLRLTQRGNNSQARGTSAGG